MPPAGSLQLARLGLSLRLLVGPSTLSCPLSPAGRVQTSGPWAREQASGLPVYTCRPGRTPQSSVGSLLRPFLPMLLSSI